MVDDDSNTPEVEPQAESVLSDSEAFEPPHYLIRILAALFSIYTIAEVNLRMLPTLQQRSLFLMFPLALAFLVRPAEASNGTARSSRYGKARDYGFALFGGLACAYWVVEHGALINRMGTPTTLDLLVGMIGVLLVVEATRRLVGWALPVIAAVFAVYAYLGRALPTLLGGHAGYGADRIVTQAFLTPEGVFGLPLGVMFTYVFPFVLFGVVLEAIGGLQFSIDMAKAILGGFRGGPAKIAVVSSAVFGMVNGSAVANVVTAGSFTIPMMKKTGVHPHVAAAVEAVASTGGQLMPPVMGAAAFIMAEYLGVPYLTIATAALIPALLFYLALFTTIHFYSVRHDIGGLAVSGRLALVLSILRRNELYMFVAPVGCLMVFLLSGSSAPRSVSFALLTALVVSLFIKKRRLTPKRILGVLERAGINAITLSCAIACVGVIIGLITLTALPARFTPMILGLAGGNTFIALILVMISSVILGMGLPTAICYILLATLAAPALENIGIQPLAAHMFILYFGMMSMVTPPTALAAYAAAVIARADIWKTMLTAWFFSLSGYLLPFMFVLNPDPSDSPFLMVGSTSQILLAATTGGLGAMVLGAAVAGHIRMRLKGWERAALLVSAALLLHSAWRTDVVGLALVAPVILRHYNFFGTRSPGTA